MSSHFTTIPTALPAALAGAERLLWPTPPAGQTIVGAHFPGGSYTSTGWFKSDSIGAGGTGRKEENCTRLLSMFFDADMLAIFKAKWLAAGLPTLGKRVKAWKQEMWKRGKGERFEALKAKHGAIVHAAMVDAMGEPTAVVDSGWGFHWFYATADDAADPASLGKLVALHNRVRPIVHAAVAAAWGIDFPDAVLDATQDAGTRIVRAWGTNNTKAPGDPRRCLPLFGSQRTLSLSDIASLTDALPEAQTKLRAQPRTGKGTSPSKAPAKSAGAPLVDAPRKGAAVDFTAHTHQGRTWLDVVAGLDIGATVKVCCPFSGSSIGSGFLSRKTQTRALFRSNAMGQTFWAKQAITGSGLAVLERYIDKDGEEKGVKNTLANVYRLLRDDESIDLWTCDFRQLPLLGLELLDPKLMQTRLRMRAETAYGWDMKCARQDVEAAILDVCQETRRNGLAEMLEPLKWDGVERLPTWIATVLGLPAGGIVSAYGRRWFISLVARIFQPGCKVDTMLVVLGKQGFGKSSMFKDIAAFFAEDVFADTAVDWRRKDSRDVLRGTLIYEDAELESFRRAGVDMMKNLLSSEMDTYRPAYGRTRERFPRTALMVGTANPVDILKDQTGNRRFWMVNAYQSERPNYDKAWLEANLEQLIAEAVDLYKQHRKSPSADTQWWLTPSEQRLSDADNEQSMEADMMWNSAEAVFERNNGIDGSWFTAQQFVAEYVRAGGFATPTAKAANALVKQASRTLAAVGFVRARCTNPANGQVKRWYMKTTDTTITDVPDNGFDALYHDEHDGSSSPDNVITI